MGVRILFFSDTHLGFDYPVRRSTRSVHRRGEQFFKNFETALFHGVEHCDLVIHGGDFFHRSEPHPSVIDRAYLTLNEAAGHGVPIVIVPGNHERSVMPPSLWLAHPCVTVIDTPRAISIGVHDHVIEIVGCPHIREARGRMGSTIDALPRIERADWRLGVIHQAVDGSTVGPADFVFRRRTDTVARAEFDPRFDWVLSGHIHRHQILPGSPPVLHCGSTERTSRAEIEEQKGFCTIDLADDRSDHVVTFHPLPMTILPEPWRGTHLAPADVLDYDAVEMARARD